MTDFRSIPAWKSQGTYGTGGSPYGYSPQSLSQIFSSLAAGGAGDVSNPGPSANLVFTSELRKMQLESEQKANPKAFGARYLKRNIGPDGSLSPITSDVLLARAPAAGQETAFRARIFETISKYPKALLPYITLEVNPSTLRCEQAKKTVVRETAGGTRYLHFGDRRGRNNANAHLSMQGSSGEIDLRGLETGDFAAAAWNLKKLLVWINLYGLTLEEAYLPGLGGDNKVTISFQSTAFPVQFEMIGHFESVMGWEQTGERVFSIQYDLKFIIEKTEPSMDEVIRNVGEVLNVSLAEVSEKARELGQ